MEYKAPRKKHAQSVTDYSEALDWLMVDMSPDDLAALIEQGESLPSAARLICDIYWISEAKLRHDLKRRWYPERYAYRREVA